MPTKSAWALLPAKQVYPLAQVIQDDQVIPSTATPASTLSPAITSSNPYHQIYQKKAYIKNYQPQQFPQYQYNQVGLLRFLIPVSCRIRKWTISSICPALWLCILPFLSTQQCTTSSCGIYKTKEQCHHDYQSSYEGCCGISQVYSDYYESS